MTKLNYYTVDSRFVKGLTNTFTHFRSFAEILFRLTFFAETANFVYLCVLQTV